MDVVLKWQVYIRNDADLSLDTLVPVAEVVNGMLSAYLGDAVLYLLPILKCEEAQINDKLDALNVRQDHSSTQNIKSSHIPKPGDSIQADDLVCLVSDPDPNYVYIPEEFIGWAGAEDSFYRYGIVSNVVDPQRKLYNVNTAAGTFVEMNVERMSYFER